VWSGLAHKCRYVGLNICSTLSRFLFAFRNTVTTIVFLGKGHMPMFDKDVFVADGLAAVRSGGGQKAVNDIVARAVSTPSAIGDEVRPWTESLMMTLWHRSDELTALHIVLPPEVDLFAHDHNMWVAVGIYGGREDNQFYTRLTDAQIQPNVGKTLLPNDVFSLGDKAVHCATNPTGEWTAALHV
jgi:hypothetical protein